MSGHVYTPADVERIAKACGKAKRTGDEFSCLCPAHDDKNPSCSVKASEEGKLLAHCHAGCEQEKVWQALQKRGLLLNGDARPAEPKREARKKVVAVYSYTNESGEVLFEVLRLEPKDFRQRRLDMEARRHPARPLPPARRAEGNRGPVRRG
jgi:putative DNA primase/helicase